MFNNFDMLIKVVTLSNCSFLFWGATIKKTAIKIYQSPD